MNAPPLHKTKASFSLIELLITFSLLAIIAAIVIPQYAKLARGANIQIAQQQADAVRKAIIGWSASLPDINSVSNSYGSFSTNYGYPSISTFTTICSNYLDPKFGTIGPNNIVLITSGNMVYGFTTPEMRNITGGAIAAWSTNDQQPLYIGGQLFWMQSPISSTTAYAQVVWLNNLDSRTRNSLPSVLLFLPH